MKTPLLALLAAVTILNTVGCGKGAPQGYHLYARFSTTQTLRVGDALLMAGVQIGYVESITPDPSRAETRVTMHIQRSVVVKTDSTATINSTAWTDRSCIVLDGGSPGASAALENTFLMTREAVKWYRKGAEQGDAKAQSTLGVCYERGDGVAKYEVEAYKWDRLAATQGDTKAKRNASLLELLLSPEQIAEGKRRAHDWLERRKESSAGER